MKKLLVLATVIVAGVAANAASFKWTANNIYGKDGNKFTGEISLMAYTSATETEDAGAAFLAATFTPTTAGVVNTTFSNDIFEGAVSYDFYMVFSQTVEGVEYTFTSDVKASTAQATAVPTLGFGNMSTATQNAANWSSVPEPTSGLLMLLGMAGLALKRKRA